MASLPPALAGRSWQEIRESASTLAADAVSGEGARRSLLSPMSESTSSSTKGLEATRPAPKADACLDAATVPHRYPNRLPDQETWLARQLPDPMEPWAPLRAGMFWGSFGLGLGVLRGFAVAFLSEAHRELPKHRAFLVGFAFSSPWYVTFLGLTGVFDCLAARSRRGGNESPRLFDASGAHAAVELG
eukprot:TRINITY_DN75921_c0_g1_i1.p1 TRINITY_DN75921_c0_g1~~TRINITY_DN75921_c0_g1_i1.p1  ORF type:complete len:209 (-),score=48.24 TRINITY_DN75921_c0_g1_i1:60-623(-)